MRRASEAVVQATGFLRYVDVYPQILLPILIFQRRRPRGDLDVADPRSLLCGPGRRLPYAQPYKLSISSGQPPQILTNPLLRALQPSVYLACSRHRPGTSPEECEPGDLHSIRVCQGVVAKSPEELTFWAKICKATNAHECARFWTFNTTHGRAPLPTHGFLRPALVPRYRSYPVVEH